MQYISLLRQHLSHSLIRNAFFMIISTAVTSGAGFLFWIIIARQFTTEQVGLATALIAVTGMLVAFSTLGLDNGLLRFLGTASNKNERISTSLCLVSIASIIASAVFITIAPTVSPHLSLVQNHAGYALGFTSVVVLTSVGILCDAIFLAHRKSQYTLFKSVAYSITKLITPFGLVTLGAFGIYMANGVALAVSVALSLWKLVRAFAYHPTIRLQLGDLRDMFHFTSVSYLASLSSNATNALLPIIILGGLGPAAVAYYYLATMIAAMLNIIPKSTAQSLLAEGALEHAELRTITIKALRVTFALLIPAVAVIVLLGHYILLAFGKEYSAESIQLLQLLSVASIFGAICYIGDALLHVQKRVNLFLCMNTFNTGLILLGTVLFVHKGLIWVGGAWLASQVITAGIYGIIFALPMRRHLLTQKEAYENL